MADKLDEFIKESCKAGKKHSEIENILVSSGWEKNHVIEALSRYVDKEYPVAIPKPQIQASSRLSFLNLFYFVVLYTACFGAIAMLFTILDYYLPDGLGRHQGFFFSNNALGESVRSYLATIMCSVPICWLTSRIITGAMIKTKQFVPRVRLNLIYLTMFIIACIMLGNAITFLYYLLSGELGVRFILKIIILTLFSVGLFFYFRPETTNIEKSV